MNLRWTLGSKYCFMDCLCEFQGCLKFVRCFMKGGAPPSLGMFIIQGQGGKITCLGGASRATYCYFRGGWGGSSKTHVAISWLVHIES